MEMRLTTSCQKTTFMDITDITADISRFKIISLSFCDTGLYIEIQYYVHIKQLSQVDVKMINICGLMIMMMVFVGDQSVT